MLDEERLSEVEVFSGLGLTVSDTESVEVEPL